MIGDGMVVNGGVMDAWLWAPGDAARAGEWAGVRWGEVDGPTTGTGTDVIIVELEYSANDVDGCEYESSPGGLVPSTANYEIYTDENYNKILFQI